MTPEEYWKLRNVLLAMLARRFQHVLNERFANVEARTFEWLPLVHNPYPENRQHVQREN